MRGSARGFTLIELMIVVSIIAILAAVGMVIYGSVQSNGRDSKRVQDIQEIQKSLETYYTLTQTYPASLGQADFQSYFQTGAPPKDPNGNSYTYYYNGSSCGPQKFLLCATMESCSSGKCTRGALSSPTGCTLASDPTSTPLKLYCVNSLN